ncbi:TonB-dependent vitamin B12 receptor [Vulcaniibacterium tengchongense]|uniref:Vitamin B12 transporter n=1 Tax=Vulcaniibacterium tengchongense TaxID=1273429 RepID=A0A3N4V803_9GAMM|nr:TonB-dependent vitamin B12 receptor [Vulcaniibacterium tengchongense]RPE75821.1 vitamin B12 transporter [Vulcaniibacterium tengchongense]
MSLRIQTLAAACALALPALVYARDATDLDQVVVTATRTAISADDALTPVEVIDRAQIERSQARSLPDLLRGRAGISLSNQGGQGKLTTLFLRGAESDHVLVLVDGIRIGSPTSGLAALQDLPIEAIDRLEIVRGPRASLYGSEAIGGVIQVFTRRDRGGFAPRVRLDGGSHGTLGYGVGFGGGNGRGWFGADFQHARTDGINACDGFYDPATFEGAGCFIAPGSQPDRDGYEKDALSLRGGIDFDEHWSLEGHALRNEGDNGFDGDFYDRAETVQQVIGGKLRWRPSSRVDLHLTAGRNVDASDNFRDRDFIDYFSTDRDSATLQGDFGLAANQLLSVGLDWLRDRVDATTAYDETERDNQAAFVQYQGRFGAHALEASVRRDDNEQFGGHTTGSAAWGLSFGGGWRLRAGYGSAFKAPTFNELYYPFFSNPNLRPEESDTWELGLAWQGEALAVNLDAFETEVEDLIAYDAALGMPNNVDRARMRGAELGVDARWGGWTLAGALSWLDTENRSGPYRGNDLARRARHGARFDLDRAFGRFRLGVTAAGEGSRYDDVANLHRLGGYGTVDLRAEYALTPALTVQARVANVFDRDYETAWFYNQPGREWYLTLRYAPGQ